MEPQQLRHEDYMRRMAEGPKPDMVNKPPHYQSAEVECIDAIKAATGDGFGYHLQGNDLKYIWRYQHKGNPVQDLKTDACTGLVSRQADRVVRPG